VLDAAEAAFAGDGISVPIDEIARRAGVGAGTVYRHFPTKEALFHAIVVGRLDRMTAQAQALAGAEDPGAAFFAFVGAVVEEGLAKRDLFDALLEGGVDVGHAHATAGKDFRDAGAALLVRAQRAGAVRDDIGIAELMALLRSISVAMRDAGEPEVLRRLIGVVSDGLRPQRRG
jgi:AcrR family transcriptional regulator